MCAFGRQAAYFEPAPPTIFSGRPRLWSFDDVPGHRRCRRGEHVEEVGRRGLSSTTRVCRLWLWRRAGSLMSPSAMGLAFLTRGRAVLYLPPVAGSTRPGVHDIVRRTGCRPTRWCRAGGRCRFYRLPRCPDFSATPGMTAASLPRAVSPSKMSRLMLAPEVPSLVCGSRPLGSLLLLRRRMVSALAPGWRR